MAEINDTTLTPTEKPCKGCGETKPLEAFSIQPAGKYGRTSRCRECHALRHLAERGPYADSQRMQLRSAKRLGLLAEPVPEDTPTGPIVKVPLKCGAFAVIDAADWPLVRDYQWLVSSNGYVLTNITHPKRTALLIHRLIMGDVAGVEYDHEDRDKLNNRRKNLRLATRSLNNANRAIKGRAFSGFKGVALVKATGRWRAEITVNGVYSYLGTFRTPEEAARTYNEAALEAFGDFATLNNID